MSEGAPYEAGEFGCTLDPTAPIETPGGKRVEIVLRKPQALDPRWTKGAAWVVLRDGKPVATVSPGFGKHASDRDGFVVWPAPIMEIGRPWRPLVDRMTQGGAVSYARRYAASLED